MDTVNTQNTVFPKVAVKAPEIVVAPVRCEVGQGLITEWVKLYNENVKTKPHSDESWNKILWSGYLPYTRHAMTCAACLEVEKSRRPKK